jgi:hypothetical protein
MLGDTEELTIDGRQDYSLLSPRLPHKLTLVLVQQQMPLSPWDAPLTLPRLDFDPASRHNQVACVLTQQRVLELSGAVPSHPRSAVLVVLALHRARGCCRGLAV